MKRETIKKSIRYIIAAAVLAVCAHYCYTHWADFKALGRIRPLSLALLGALTLAYLYLVGYTFAILVRMISVRLRPREIFSLSILTSFGNLLGPAKPGVAIRAVYLKKNWNFAYTHYVSVSMAQVLLNMTILTALGLCLLAFLSLRGMPVPWVLMGLCLGAFVATGVPLLTGFPDWLMGRLPGWVGEKIRNAVSGYDEIRRQKKLFGLVALSLVAQVIVGGAGYYMAFHALDRPVGFLGATMVFIFGSLSGVVSITPSNIGVQEAVSAYIITLTGVDFATGVVTASLMRIVFTVVSIGFAPLGYFLLRARNGSGASLS